MMHIQTNDHQTISDASTGCIRGHRKGSRRSHHGELSPLCYLLVKQRPGGNQQNNASQCAPLLTGEHSVQENFYGSSIWSPHPTVY